MIRLRPLEFNDFDRVRDWIENPALREYFRRFPPAGVWLSKDSFLQWLVGYYVVEQDEQAVGLCNIANLDQHSKNAEFGIMIAPQPGPRGRVAKEALKQLFEYAFAYMGLNKLYCLVLPHRDEIAAMCAKNGLSTEGVLRNNLFFDGKYHDEIQYSMLSEEYLKHKDR